MQADYAIDSESSLMLQATKHTTFTTLIAMPIKINENYRYAGCQQNQLFTCPSDSPFNYSPVQPL